MSKSTFVQLEIFPLATETLEKVKRIVKRSVKVLFSFIQLDIFPSATDYEVECDFKLRFVVSLKCLTLDELFSKQRYLRRFIGLIATLKNDLIRSELAFRGV